MSFFKKIGKAISKGVKSVAKAVGKVAQNAAPVAALIPGIGAPIAAGLGIVGGVLGPKEKAQAAYDSAIGYLSPPAAVAPPGQVQPVGGGIGFGAIAALAALFFLIRS